MTCNMCGETYSNMNPTKYHWVFGEGSEYDGQEWEFSLCDNCRDYISSEIAYMFVIEPKGFIL